MFENLILRHSGLSLNQVRSLAGEKGVGKKFKIPFLMVVGGVGKVYLTLYYFTNTKNDEFLRD